MPSLLATVRTSSLKCQTKRGGFSMPRPLYRFSSHFMPILAVIIVISTALLALSIFPSPMSAYAVGGSSSPCQLTVQNNDPSLQNIVRRSQLAFNTVCPELVKRFALKPDVANN